MRTLPEKLLYAAAAGLVLFALGLSASSDRPARLPANPVKEAVQSQLEGVRDPGLITGARQAAR